MLQSKYRIANRAFVEETRGYARIGRGKGSANGGQEVGGDGPNRNPNSITLIGGEGNGNWVPAGALGKVLS